MRPTTFKVDNTVYWTIRTYTDAGVLVNADSTPSVAVRKNGASVADVVTVTKRAATTGIYDCSYNPSGEVEGDSFTIEETATLSSQAYENAWSIEAQAAERGTDSANTVAPDNASIAAILVDTADLQANQGNWLTATGFSTHSASDVVTAMQAVSGDFKADVSALATQTSVNTIDGIVDAILVDTADLQANQGNWLTATGFSTHSAGDVAAAVLVTPANKLATDASGNVEANNMRGTDGANTVAPDNASITAILADTNELQQNQGDWATATGFATHSAADVATAILVTPANKLATDVSGNVEANNMRGTDGANTVAPDNTTINDINNALPNNMSLMDIDINGAVLSQLTPEQIYLYLTASNRNDNFKADVSGLSTHSASDVATAILVTPANKLATDASGNVEANNMRGTDGANTVAPDNASITAILADTNELQQNQGDWATATGFATHSASDVANLILVTPANKLATDVSGNVEANNMRGTDSANTVAPDNASITAILADTNELQTNQGDWATATGFSTHSAADVVTAMQAVSGDFKADVSALATQTSVNTIDGIVDAILVDTNDLQTNQGNWLTATGFSTFDASVDTVTTDTASRDASKADVSSLSTFDHTSDQVVASNMRGTDNALLASSAPANWSTLIVGTGADAGKVTTSNPASGGGSNHTAQDVANLILVTPANKLATDGSGNVEANNMRGTDNASTFDHSTDTVITDTASRNASKADISSLATQLSVDSIDTDIQNIGSDVSAILTDTNELQQNQGDWATATTVVASNMRGTDNALLAASAPANWSTLIVGTGADAGKVTTSNPASGGGSNHTAQDVANLILVTPANKLATDASGNVEANNMRGTDNVVTIDANDVENAVWNASVSSHNVSGSFGKFMRVLKEGTITVEGSVNDASATTTTFVTDLTNTTSSFYHDKLIVFISGQNSGQTRHIDAYNGATKEIVVSDDFSFTPADGDEFLILASHEYSNVERAAEVVSQMQVVANDFKADVSNLSQFDPTTDVVARVTLVDTTTDLTNQNSGGTNPADIYTYFTDASREDVFKADLSGVTTLITNVDTKVTNLNDFNPATTPVTTDNASRDASKADISTLATITQINALDVKVTDNGVKLDDTVKKNQNYRYTNYGTGTGFDLVTITEA